MLGQDGCWLSTEQQALEGSWAEDCEVGCALVTQHLFASEEDYETSHTNTREKHELRAQAVNCSALGVRVFLWEDAEVISKQLIDANLGIVRHGHELKFVFYVGASHCVFFLYHLYLTRQLTFLSGRP